jgi:hypothetical protein
MLLGIPAVTTVVGAGPAVADATHQVAVDMPFTGKWAYNANVNPPWTDSNSSHPSVHHTPGGGDWATDLYGAEGTAVKLKVSNPTDSLSFSWGTSSTSCGQSTRINVLIGGVNVGWVYFAHIDNAVTSGPISNGMTIGTVHDWGGCNPGTHVHVEYKNTSNYSCWVGHGNPGASLNLGDHIGVLGSTNTGAKQECTSIPDGGGQPSAQGIQHIYSGTADGKIRETYWGGGNTLTTGDLYQFGTSANVVTNIIWGGVQHVYTGTADGKVFETYWGNGNSLTTWQIADFGAAITSIDATITSNGVQHVYTGNVDGYVRETYWGGGNTLTSWTVASLSSPVRGLDAEITSNGVQHIFSGTDAGNIWESYWGGGNSLTNYVLTSVNGSVASLDFMITSNGVYHIFSGTSSGRIYETYWGAGNSLTTAEMANFGTAVGGTTAQVYNGVTHIYTGLTDGTVWETYWGGGNTLTSWQIANIGTAVTTIDSQITSDNVQHVYTGDGNGILRETYWGNGNSLTTWQIVSLGSAVKNIVTKVT